MSDDLVGDPLDYNPQRKDGREQVGGIDAALRQLESDDGDGGGLDSGPSDSPPDPVDVLRDWLRGYGFPVSRIRVYEHHWYGTLQIEVVGGLGDDEFQRFIGLMKETDGIGWDPKNQRNYCSPEFIERLVGDHGA